MRVGEAVKYGADVERLQVVDGVVGKVGLGGSVGLALRELFPLVAWGERTRAGGEIEGNVDANGNANSNAARERDNARSERGVGATTSEKNHKQDTNDAGNTPAAPLTHTAIVRCMCKNKGVLPGWSRVRIAGRSNTRRVLAANPRTCPRVCNLAPHGRRRPLPTCVPRVAF